MSEGESIKAAGLLLTHWPNTEWSWHRKKTKAPFHAETRGWCVQIIPLKRAFLRSSVFGCEKYQLSVDGGEEFPDMAGLVWKQYLAVQNHPLVLIYCTTFTVCHLFVTEIWVCTCIHLYGPLKYPTMQCTTFYSCENCTLQLLMQDDNYGIEWTIRGLRHNLTHPVLA